MAMKTVLKQLLNKYGLLSVELQQAFEVDQAAIDEKGNKQYVDNSDYEEVVDTGEIIEEDSKPTKTTKKVASEPKTTIVVENEAEQDVSNLFEEAFDEEEAF